MNALLEQLTMLRGASAEVADRALHSAGSLTTHEHALSFDVLEDTLRNLRKVTDGLRGPLDAFEADGFAVVARIRQKAPELRVQVYKPDAFFEHFFGVVKSAERRRLMWRTLAKELDGNAIKGNDGRRVRIRRTTHPVEWIVFAENLTSAVDQEFERRAGA